MKFLVPLLLAITVCSNEEPENQPFPNADVGQLGQSSSARDALTDIYVNPTAYEDEVVSICGPLRGGGQEMIVGNMGRSLTVIRLDRPINAASSCLIARFMRTETLLSDPRLMDGPIALAGWQLKVVRILPIG